MKKKVLLFARSFLADYYSGIKTDIFEPIFVTLTIAEKKLIINKGYHVYGCFEEQYDKLEVEIVSDCYLKTSFHNDRFLNRFPYEKRCEILGKEVSFWRSILKEKKPDILVNETVAIELAEVMAIEAERCKIPFYTSLLGFLPNTFYWKPNPFNGRLNDLSSIIPSKDDNEIANEYIEGVLTKQTRPFYVSSIKYKLSVVLLLKTLVWGMFKYLKDRICESKKNFTYEDYSFTYFSYPRLFINSIMYQYDKIDDLKSRCYLFYPLHVEPEATLSYFTDEPCSQISLIEHILNSMKLSQYLVIKEHPQQPGTLLSKEYRILKSRYKNLIYLPAKVKSFDVLKNTDGIVTITSSAAWEGVLLNKPVFVLGKIFFDQCPGVTPIENISELSKKLRCNKYTMPNDSTTRKFVAQMVSIFKSGCPTPQAKDTGIDEYTRQIEILVRDEDNPM